VSDRRTRAVASLETETATKLSEDRGRRAPAGTTLRQQLAFIKATSTLKVTPVILEELRMAQLSWNKKTVVTAGSRSIALGGPKASQHPSIRLEGKCKAIKQANLGDKMQPIFRLPEPPH
jgi:hypothetical protein